MHGIYNIKLIVTYIKRKLPTAETGRKTKVIKFFFLLWLDGPSGATPPHCRGFEIKLRHTKLGRTPLDEWSARRRHSCLTTHNTRKRLTTMPPAGFEPEIPTSDRPQTHAFDRAATGIGLDKVRWRFFLCLIKYRPLKTRDGGSVTSRCFLPRALDGGMLNIVTGHTRTCTSLFVYVFMFS